MERARKRLASAFDGIMAQFGDDSQEETTSIVDSTVRNEFMQKEKIKSENCRLVRIVRHGFPDGPKCMAFDPVQKLLAIGAARGCVRLLGQAGVDQLLKHESEESVMQIQFLINEGGLVTALQDDTLHLWNYRQRIPEVVHSLRMSKERITAIHLPFQSKWLIVGTDKGNIYFVSLSSFELSNQIIYWNKAVDMTCRTHPGSIRLIESSPIEPSKLLILFDKGPVVLWNCITKEVDRFTAASELNPVTAVSWNNDAKQILCGHQNGSLSIWNVKKPKELVHRSFPHSSPDDLSSPIPCKAINQLYWNTNADGEMIVFTGGMPSDEGSLPSLTVLRAKGSLTVLEMDHAIVSMLPLNSTPYASVSQLPSAIAVLLKNDLLVVDMTAQGYPCFEIPHPMDLHESPVTILRYYSDCPLEMIAALTLAGRNQRRQGVRLSDKQWPISGGIGRECATGHQEIFLTGHEDGSIKFWQASSEQLQILYKLKSGRHFEKSSASKLLQQNANTSEKPQIAMVSHAVAYLELCMHSRFLLVASSSGQVTLFHFAKSECCQTITVIPLPQLCRSTISLFSPSGPLSPPPENLDNVTSNQNRLQQSMSSGSNGSQKGELKRQGPVSESQFSKDSSQSIDSQMADFMPLKVRAGALRRPAGYQPEIVCQIPWINGLRPEPITALSLNSSYGLIAMGTAFGLALIDTKETMICKTWSNMQLFEPMAPLCSALTGQDVQQIFTPSNEGHSPSKTLLTQPASTPIQRPNSSRSLRARLKHQFSTQTPPVQPPKSPGPLFRGNTTDSVQDNNRLLTVGSRLQRPQLMKAFTFNPTNPNSNNIDDELKVASIWDSAASPLNKPSQQNCNGNLSLDSHASSIESLEKMGMLVQQQNTQEWVNECEFVSFIQFINSPDKSGVTEPCIWLGTSYGASLFIQLNLLTKNTSSVNIAPSESFRLQGRIIHMAFLDRNFCLLNGPSENYKNVQQERTTREALSQISIGSTEESGVLEEKDKKGLEGEQNKSNKARKKWELLKAKVLTKTNQSPKLASQAEKHEENFSQLAFFIAESEIRAVALPNNKQLFERYFLAKSPDEIPLVRAHSSHVCGQPILAALNAAGAIIVLSLPSLRSLMCSALFPHSVDIDDRICHRFELSENGLGIYMISPSEVQKFTISSDIAAQMTDCMGELFIPCDMPEPPKQQSFFRGVMSTLAAAAGANSSSSGYAIEQLIEMDTILSEKPASSMGTSQVRTVAKPLFTQQQHQQLGGIETGTSKTLTAGQAAKEAMQNLAERNERLNAVTDATEQLRMNAEQIQSRSAKLLDKYEKKKWFQL